jgi:hypothetical protein
MPCPDAIAKLVERFADQHDSYKLAAYNETQVRREFIDPMFTALGWDVDNRAGHAKSYKDVIHEDAIKIGGTTKAPDYGARIGGAAADGRARRGRDLRRTSAAGGGRRR